MTRRSAERPSTNRSHSLIQSGRTFHRRPKTSCPVSKHYILITDFPVELLHKDKAERIEIKDALDHPWFVGANNEISQMRQDAHSDGNDMMKFISYSNHDPNVAADICKKSVGSNSPGVNNYNAGSLLAPGQNMLEKLNHGPGSGNLPGAGNSLLADK